MLTFKTYQNLYNDTISLLLSKVPKDVDVVVGVPRSGMLPATIIATELHLPLGVATPAGAVIAEGGHRAPRTRYSKILLVDDSFHVGNSMIRARKYVANHNIVTACVYTSPAGTKHLDIFGEMVPAPRIFEWNLFNSWATTEGMFDLDGVFCQDPPVWDDDGPRYQAALTNAKPLHLPKVPVGAVCTNRIERWRGITEAWLTKHNITTNQLVMQPYKTAAERRAKSDPAQFKLAQFQKSNAKLFIESHDWQAKVIARAGRPVISLESKRVFQ
jgi:hypothetical protein